MSFSNIRVANKRPLNMRFVSASMTHKNKQGGFTLVELLVGLILTVFISAIAITYMWSSAQVFRTQTNDSLSHENARYALELLSQNIRLAGQNRPNNIAETLDVVYNGDTCAADDGNNANGDVNACTVDTLINDPDVLASDRLAVDYLAITNVTGCNGIVFNATVVTPQRLVNVFWVADVDGDGIRSLYCQTINVTNDVANVNGGTAQPLIDGIDAMQIQYGVATGVDVDPFNPIQRYQSYTNLIASGGLRATGNVKAIRLALLVNSGLAAADGGARGDVLLEAAQDRTYQLLDEAVTVADERVFRQIYSTTIAIPNTL